MLQDRARDSFENLLFSICRFKQFTGQQPVHLILVACYQGITPCRNESSWVHAGDYPSKFTIISYDFKRPRFIDLHARTLGISDNQIAFLGTPAIDPEGAQKVWHLPSVSISKNV